MSAPKLIKPLLALTGGNLAGKLLGICRELLQSALWGTSFVISAYRMAQAAVLIPINFLTAETLTAGFIPLLRRLRSEDKQKALALEQGVFGLVLIFSVVITAALLGKTHWFIRLLAPGFDEAGVQQTVLFVRIMAAGIPFYIAGSYFSCREMAGGCFFLPSIRASVQSVGLLIGLVVASFLSAPAFIATGFSGAYVFFFWMGWRRAVHSGWGGFNFRLLAENKGVFKQFWHVVRPLFLLPFFLQGAIGVEKAIASLIGGGGVAALDYAKFITESGIYMIAVPLGLVGLSMLSDFTERELPKWVGHKVILVLLVCVPASFALYAFGEIIIRLVYQRGAFDAQATELTASILKFLGIGFWAQVGGYFFMKVLNARMRNHAFIRIMLVALVVQSAVSYFGYNVWGARILGLSVSIYGVITFLAGAVALRLPGKVFKVLAWLLVGGCGAVGAVQLAGKSGFSEGIQVVLFGCVWLICVVGVSLLRHECIGYLRTIFEHARRKR